MIHRDKINTVRALKKTAAFIMFFLLIVQTAHAVDEKTYEIHKEGTCGAEIGIVTENCISLDSEELVIDFSHVIEPVGDEVKAGVNATYVLTNTSSEEVYTSIAVPKLVKVKKVTVERTEADGFVSGQTIMVDGEKINGLIYSNSTMEKLRKESVYDNDREILAHVDYKVCFDEAFSKYAVTDSSDAIIKETDSNGAPLSETIEYYIESDEGEFCLCSVVYNLHFAPNESKILTTTSDFTGEMSRVSRYTTEGTVFDFSYVGSNLNGFSHIEDVHITFILPDGDILPMIDCDAATYKENDYWTIHYKGDGVDFSFSLGEELTEDELNKIKTSHGSGKILTNIALAVGIMIVTSSALFICYSVKQRKESGIER